MATIQFKRHLTDATLPSTTLASGEPFFNKQTNKLYIGDGTTALSGLNHIGKIATSQRATAERTYLVGAVGTASSLPTELDNMRYNSNIYVDAYGLHTGNINNLTMTSDSTDGISIGRSGTNRVTTTLSGKLAVNTTGAQIGSVSKPVYVQADGTVSVCSDIYTAQPLKYNNAVVDLSATTWCSVAGALTSFTNQSSITPSAMQFSNIWNMLTSAYSACGGLGEVSTDIAYGGNTYHLFGHITQYVSGSITKYVLSMQSNGSGYSNESINDMRYILEIFASGANPRTVRVCREVTKSDIYTTTTTERVWYSISNTALLEVTPLKSTLAWS